MSTDGCGGPPPPNGVNQAAVVAALQSVQATGVMPNGVVSIDQQNANVSYRLKVILFNHKF